jgi:hypothetical protein
VEKFFFRKLLDTLDKINETTNKFEFSEISDQVKGLKDKINKDIFKIAFIGKFSTGKSTLINAFINMDLLPMENIASSKCIAEMSYSPIEEYYLDDNGTRKILERKDLKEWPKKPLSQDNRIIAKIPAEELNNRFTVLDTPGLYDEKQTYPQITYEIIPQSDAIVYLVHCGYYQEKDAYEFIENQILSHDKEKKLIIVGTFLDKIDDNPEKIKKNFTELYGKYINPKNIFFVNCVAAFEARLKNDNEILESSGYNKFYKGLTEIVFSYRGIEQKRIYALETENICRAILLNLNGLKEDKNKTERELKIKETENKINGINEQFNKSIQKISNKLDNFKDEFKININSYLLKVKNNFESKIDQSNYDNLKKSIGIIENAFYKNINDFLEDETKKLSDKIGKLTCDELSELQDNLSKINLLPESFNIIIKDNPLAKNPEYFTLAAMFITFVSMGWFSWIPTIFVLMLGRNNIEAIIKELGGNLTENNLKDQIKNKLSEKIEQERPNIISSINKMFSKINDKIFENISIKKSEIILPYKQELNNLKNSDSNKFDPITLSQAVKEVTEIKNNLIS